MPSFLQNAQVRLAFQNLALKADTDRDGRVSLPELCRYLVTRPRGLLASLWAAHTHMMPEPDTRETPHDVQATDTTPLDAPAVCTRHEAP